MTRLRGAPFLWLLVFLLAFLLLTAGGRIAPQDEETTFRMTANLIEYGRTTITEQDITLAPQTFSGFLPGTQPRTLLTTWAVPGRDGQKYPQFMPGQAIVNIPLYLLGHLLSGEPLNLRTVILTHWTTSLFNPIVIALTGWLIALFASRLGYSRRLSVGLGLAYALCTMVLPYTGTYFSEPVIALLILLAAYAVYAARAPVHVMRWLIVAGMALGLTIFIRERSVIMLPPFILYVFLYQRRVRWRGWAAFFGPLVAGGIVIGLFNWSRYGSPLTFGFSALQHTSFTTPLVLGLYGLLISPGKGLLLYNPIAWAGLIGLAIMFRTRRREAILFALIMLAELLFFALYEFWTGGWNWGPRYIMPVLPLLVLAAGEWVHVNPTRLRKTVLVALCLSGFVLNLPAVLVDHSRYLVSFGERDPQHYLDRSILNLSDSPLTQQWPMVFDVADLYTRPATWQAAHQAVTEHLNDYAGDDSLESLSTHALWFDEFFRLNTPDFWFVHLPWLGFSPVAVGLFALALLIVTVFSAWKVWLMLQMNDAAASNPERKTRNRPSHLVPALIVLLSAVYKLVLLAFNAVPFNGDEAIVALMARHILQGERPAFFYGQAYLGATDAWLAAVSFAILGESVLAIRVVHILLFAGVVFTTYLLARRYVHSEWGARAAMLWTALPPTLLTLYTTATLGGYTETLLFGNILLLLADGQWLLTDRRRAGRWLLFGIIAGFAFYTFPLILLYLIPIGLLLLYRLRLNAWREYLAALLGCALGSAPWWLALIQSGGALVGELTGSAVAGTVQSAGSLSGLGIRLLNFFLFGTTAWWGLRYPWSAEFVLPVLGAGALLFYLGAFGYAVKRGPRVLWGMIATLLATFLLTPFGGDPSGRYFLPLVVPLAIFTAMLLQRIRKQNVIVASLLLTLLVGYNVVGTLAAAVRNPPGVTTQFDPVTWIDHTRDQELIAFLLANGETRGYTNYWVQTPIAFLSGERIISAARLPYHLALDYTPRDDRYPPFTQAVREAPRAFYITVNHPKLDELLRGQMMKLGVTFKEHTIGNYHIFYGLSRKVEPEELGIYDSVTR